MTNKDLERLLKEDPMLRFRTKMKRVHENLETKYALRHSKFIHVVETFKNFDNLKMVMDLKDHPDEDGIWDIASKIGVSYDDLKGYIDLKTERNKEFLMTIGIDELKEESEKTLENSNVSYISSDNFPEQIEKPFIVFYCKGNSYEIDLEKLAYAKLADFYDQENLADLYFSDDMDLLDREDVAIKYPLVAYFKDATVFRMSFPSIGELWDVMNELAIKGKDFKGKGFLYEENGKYDILEEMDYWTKTLSKDRKT